MGLNLTRQNHDNHGPTRQQVILNSNTIRDQNNILNINQNNLNFIFQTPNINSHHFLKIKSAKAIKNPCNINRKSINLSDNGRILEFLYDCTEDALFSLYSTDSIDENIIENLNPILEIHLPNGINTSKIIHLDKSLINSFLILLKPLSLVKYDINIKDNNKKTRYITSSIASDKKNIQNIMDISQFTFCRINMTNNNQKDKLNIIRVIRQCVKYNGKIFELQDLYGLNITNNSINEQNKSNDKYSQDDPCVICLTNPKQTILLPCRHACLCIECTNNLLARNISCPVCRQCVSGLVNIENNTNNQ
ncbi:zinc finger, C3HC4 type domain-containing protein [Cryptosporidium serpentis]